MNTCNYFFFFFFFETLIEERASVLQAICVYTAEFSKFFRTLISLTLQNKHTGTGYYNAVGWRSLAEMFTLALLIGNMDSKQGLNFWSKSVWKGSCLNNFNDSLLHTILCPVPYISFITVHLLWCPSVYLVFTCPSWCPFVWFSGVSEETCCNVYISLVILHDGFAEGDCIPEGILF